MSCDCWVQAHLEDGSRQARAWHVPEAELCRKVAEHHCGAQQHVTACTASFGNDGQASPLRLFAPDAAPQTPPTPAPPVAGAAAP